jgi:hypothetical protein
MATVVLDLEADCLPLAPSTATSSILKLLQRDWAAEGFSLSSGPLGVAYRDRTGQGPTWERLKTKHE